MESLTARYAPAAGRLPLAVTHGCVAQVVAVGECGLDYDRTQFCAAETQKQFFERQFALADEFGLPMFLHNRNTGGDFVRVWLALPRAAAVNTTLTGPTALPPSGMMREHASARTRGVVHSFTGSSEEAEELMGMGLFIGACARSTRPASPHTALLFSPQASTGAP